ncbi:hypothetical protein P775_15635 [Puniceibacterium antarcticum]|uniref:Uncharacterized protein n=1 Tax=Puniceibacterium antarcticum TaxID=1206336 RepID=A0A2G8RDP2_9RHOB|nr:hypothetical protein P775_15635 [Puniceibacterium antarcticum]
MRGGLHLFAFLRAVFLCALFAFSLGLQTAEAHMDARIVSVETIALSNDDHIEIYTVIEGDLSHCHPGLDCAVTAIAVETTPAPRGISVHGERLQWR